jgi:membrane-bound metal-dependent hydrolase YbcI (DUF457 family)
MDNLAYGLLLSLFIASAVKAPSAASSDKEPNAGSSGSPKPSNKRGSKLTDKITEATIDKLTGEAFDFIKSIFFIRLRTLVASIFAFTVAYLADNIDRLIMIGVFVCLLALVCIVLLIYVDIRVMRKYVVESGRKQS